jgi:hypothetical protein
MVTEGHPMSRLDELERLHRCSSSWPRCASPSSLDIQSPPVAAPVAPYRLALCALIRLPNRQDGMLLAERDLPGSAAVEVDSGRRGEGISSWDASAGGTPEFERLRIGRSVRSLAGPSCLPVAPQLKREWSLWPEFGLDPGNPRELSKRWFATTFLSSNLTSCWTGGGVFAKFKFGWELRELEGVPLRCVTIVSTTSNPGLPTSVRSLSPATSTRVLEDLLHRMTVQPPSALFPAQSLPSLRT